MDIYEEIDRFLEENLGEASITDTAKHFFKLGQTPNWISVDDELPKADGRYIIADKYGGVEQMNFDAESKYWWLRGTGEMRDFVTHWMPLPQPPRKEK